MAHNAYYITVNFWPGPSGESPENLLQVVPTSLGSGRTKAQYWIEGGLSTALEVLRDPNIQNRDSGSRAHTLDYGPFIKCQLSSTQLDFGVLWVAELGISSGPETAVVHSVVSKCILDIQTLINFNLRTTAEQKCGAVPRRAQIQGS